MTTPDPWIARISETEGTRGNDRRNPFERDRARLIHSAAFRRLQAKTQVLGLSEGDFHRTRLTHSMEVAQIARGLVLQLQVNEDISVQFRRELPLPELAEAIAFGHDLGHPPFGHGGEVALNYMMRDNGGFEGNGQSLRILTRLESAHPGFGLDLTRRTLLGLLKYPRPYSHLCRLTPGTPLERFAQLSTVEWKPPKCFLDTEQALVDWLLRPFSQADRDAFTALSQKPTDTRHGKTAHKSLDCSIMELADDIAYGAHDFEDGIALGLIREDAWDGLLDHLDAAWSQAVGLHRVSVLGRELFQPLKAGGNRKKAIGALVHAFISSAQVRESGTFEHPLLRLQVTLPVEARTFLDAVQAVVFTHVINLQTVQSLEYRGRVFVMKVFDAIASDPERLLSHSFAHLLADHTVDVPRVICDYVAGMTDLYATRMYERFYVPREGTVFERL
jgi:dGTPase